MSDDAFALLRPRLLSILQVTEVLMPSCRLPRSWRVLALAISCSCLVSVVQAQGAKQTVPQNSIPHSDADHIADHIKERNECFFRGRLVQGKNSAELRRRAY
jgi:hypothetical protein